MSREFPVRIASLSDLDQIRHADYLTDVAALKKKIERSEILVIEEEGQLTGILRFMLFWDYLPFINLLWVREGFRREHRASRLIGHLEEITQGTNHGRIMTSTQSDETAQNFFRRVGFVDAGGFTLPEQPFELIMVKYLDQQP